MNEDTITTTQIADRIGLKVTVQFLQGLGIEPVGRDRASVLWAASDWPKICDAICAHIQKTKGAA